MATLNSNLVGLHHRKARPVSRPALQGVADARETVRGRGSLSGICRVQVRISSKQNLSPLGTHEPLGAPHLIPAIRSQQAYCSRWPTRASAASQTDQSQRPALRIISATRLATRSSFSPYTTLFRSTLNSNLVGLHHRKARPVSRPALQGVADARET